MFALSVIIPALDEEEYIGRCLASLRGLEADVIVVDGGSQDATIRHAIEGGARVLTSDRGRGLQLRAGADAACGDWLFFLHADSELLDGAHEEIARAMHEPDLSIAKCRVRFDGTHPAYRVYQWCARFDSFWTSFGDQGMLIRRRLYDEAGGFPPWPFLEDVALFNAARRRSRVRRLDAVVLTSARRFEMHGVLRQQLLNATLLMRFRFGVPAVRLAEVYMRRSRAWSRRRGRIAYTVRAAKDMWLPWWRWLRMR